MITIDCDRCVLILKIPYNRDFVEEIKHVIPQRVRCYDPKLKLWYVRPDYLTTLTNMLEKHFDLNEEIKVG